MSVCRALEHEVRVAFLGPWGTYSEEALWSFFGREVQANPEASIEDTIRALQVGTVDFAVVPVENSTEGSVARTLDAMVDADVRVCGEVQLPICHQLLSQSGQLADIVRVCAHPQALAQCRQWLATHLPDVPCEPVSSNGQAASMASQHSGVAAIAGLAAQQRYQLQPCAANIHDDVHNTTRFLVLGQNSAGPSGVDKTSLVVAVPNTPGALHQLLAPLAAQQVSLTRFESRPARTGRWEYYFFMDLAGHEQDTAVASVLEQLRTMASFFKVLGSYPVADRC
jgi:chorismate mutase/prephenate dehydratase